jgi:hypothetical protein
MKKKNFLSSRTGKGYIYWLRKIEKLIVKHSYEGTTNKEGFYHDSTNPKDWVLELTDEIMKTFPGGYRDENMCVASLLSFILMKWFVQLVRAKSHDPKRRLKDRRMMAKVRADFCMRVVEFMVDESEDAKIFPNQKWEGPFAPNVTDGKYR